MHGKSGAAGQPPRRNGALRVQYHNGKFRVRRNFRRVEVYAVRTGDNEQRAGFAEVKNICTQGIMLLKKFLRAVCTEIPRSWRSMKGGGRAGNEEGCENRRAFDAAGEFRHERAFAIFHVGPRYARETSVVPCFPERFAFAAGDDYASSIVPVC